MSDGINVHNVGHLFDEIIDKITKCKHRGIIVLVINDYTYRLLKYYTTISNFSSVYIAGKELETFAGKNILIDKTQSNIQGVYWKLCTIEVIK